MTLFFVGRAIDWGGVVVAFCRHDCAAVAASCRHDRRLLSSRLAGFNFLFAGGWWVVESARLKKMNAVSRYINLITMDNTDLTNNDMRQAFKNYGFDGEIDLVDVSVYEKTTDGPELSVRVIKVVGRIWSMYCERKVARLGGENNIFLSLDGIKYGKAMWTKVLKMMYFPNSTWLSHEHYDDRGARVYASDHGVDITEGGRAHMMLAVTSWLDMYVPSDKLNKSMLSFIDATRATMTSYLRMYVHFVVPTLGAHDFGDDCVMITKDRVYERWVDANHCEGILVECLKISCRKRIGSRQIMTKSYVDEFNTSADEIVTRACVGKSIPVCSMPLHYGVIGEKKTADAKITAKLLIRYARMELLFSYKTLLKIDERINLETAAEISRLLPRISNKKWFDEFISVLAHGIGVLPLVD